MASTSMEQNQIGELLLRENLVTREQLDKALKEQQHGGTRIGFSLVSAGAVSEAELTRLLSRQYRVPAVDLSDVEVDPSQIFVVVWLDAMTTKERIMAAWNGERGGGEVGDDEPPGTESVTRAG